MHLNNYICSIEICSIFLILLPKKRQTESAIYLLEAGATGIAAVELVMKSRSELAADIKSERELGVSKRR